MKKYKLLFFDIDDTLLNYKYSEEEALKNIYVYFKSQISFENLCETYKKINHQLWKNLEKNKITFQQLLNTRWDLVLQENKIKTIDPTFLNQKYREYFIDHTKIFPFVDKIIHALSKKYQMAIITNGFIETQTKRLQKVSLDSFFTYIITPESCLACKPSKKIFSFAMSKFPDIKPNDILMIGDNFYSDIIGAQRANIDSCYISNKKIIRDQNNIPTYQIPSIENIKDILLG